MRFSWYGRHNDETNSIPLPAKTPYDDDAGARAVYLQSYWQGYQFATENPYLVGDRYHDQGPYAIPQDEGRSHGETDAKRATDKRWLDEEMRKAAEGIKRQQQQWQNDQNRK